MLRLQLSESNRWPRNTRSFSGSHKSLALVVSHPMNRIIVTANGRWPTQINNQLSHVFPRSPSHCCLSMQWMVPWWSLSCLTITCHLSLGSGYPLRDLCVFGKFYDFILFQLPLSAHYALRNSIHGVHGVLASLRPPAVFAMAMYFCRLSSARCDSSCCRSKSRPLNNKRTSLPWDVWDASWPCCYHWNAWIQFRPSGFSIFS